MQNDLTDDQWKILDLLIPEPAKRDDGRGRPWKSRRSVMNGVLWVLRTGAPWADLPDRYPSFQTRPPSFRVHRKRHASRMIVLVFVLAIALGSGVLDHLARAALPVGHVALAAMLSAVHFIWPYFAVFLFIMFLQWMIRDAVAAD